MTQTQEDSAVPVFEIDQAEIYSQYFLRNRLEILSTLRAIEKRHNIVTVYIGDGTLFFLSTIITVNDDSGLFFLDPSKQDAINQQAVLAEQLTLSANLDRVKTQIRLQSLKLTTLAGKPVFSAALPERILRLQRREFFRLETPRAHPLRCKVAAKREAGIELFDFPLFDISGGGLSLIGNVGLAEKFTLGELFQDCRLEIPGESVLSVNLRVREILKIELPSGEQQLRLGCEFISLPGTRLTLIERYITRVERERKTRESGL